MSRSSGAAVVTRRGPGFPLTGGGAGSQPPRWGKRRPDRTTGRRTAVGPRVGRGGGGVRVGAATGGVVAASTVGVAVGSQGVAEGVGAAAGEPEQATATRQHSAANPRLSTLSPHFTRCRRQGTD